VHRIIISCHRTGAESADNRNYKISRDNRICRHRLSPESTTAKVTKKGHAAAQVKDTSIAYKQQPNLTWSELWPLHGPIHSMPFKNLLHSKMCRLCDTNQPYSSTTTSDVNAHAANTTQCLHSLGKHECRDCLLGFPQFLRRWGLPVAIELALCCSPLRLWLSHLIKEFEVVKPIGEERGVGIILDASFRAFVLHYDLRRWV